MKRSIINIVLMAVGALCFTAAAQHHGHCCKHACDNCTEGRVQNAGDNGTYFTAPAADCTAVDNEGFIRRWMILEPINKPNRSNTVFTDSYLHNELYKEYFKDQFSVVPKDGEKVKLLIIEPEPDFGNDFRRPATETPKPKPKTPKKVTLQWHDLESTGYNVQLYRFARAYGKQVYGVIFWVVAVIDCPEEINDVRLSVGSNSASMWWLDGKEVLTLSGDRRMVRDDAMSDRLTLHQGRNFLRGAIINGPGMSNFCARFLNNELHPITAINTCK